MLSSSSQVSWSLVGGGGERELFRVYSVLGQQLLPSVRRAQRVSREAKERLASDD